MAAISGACSSVIPYMAGKLYESATWMRVMTEAFDETDRQTEVLNARGSWMGRTGNIATYSHVDLYY
ncbi:MAG TPA: hypothetical protein PLN69_04345 [bacterium]|nr:hypothetical protein [bacterium]